MVRRTSRELTRFSLSFAMLEEHSADCSEFLEDDDIDRQGGRRASQKRGQALSVDLCAGSNVDSCPGDRGRLLRGYKGSYVSHVGESRRAFEQPRRRVVAIDV
jgi:hypothetical protein